MRHKGRWSELLRYIHLWDKWLRLRPKGDQIHVT
ncbi:hypothetical protein TcasGA2_TC034511 [Tribolium castaneum]|uniref:Uncharacterized protein n=1 Tax=Tribolium castaneum TaxID=7070 RepID=A0A139WGH7_TRICA|nr:hypothetical protein TcasGA2_TC034511 [Tribolium castaneum]